MERFPVVIDVDTGTDDAIAITAALLCQNILDIRAFTAVMGNVTVDKTSRNTLDLVDHLGWDIQVAVGADRPLVTAHTAAVSHGNTGLGDVTLPPATRCFSETTGYETIYREAVKANGQLQLLAVGPLTNLALAIRHHPDIVDLVQKITIMGGSLCGGNMTMTSEFNIYNDPEAAKAVYEAGIPLTMIGLDVTLKPQLPRWVYAKVKAADNPYARFAAQVFDFMYRRKDEFGGDDPNLHDVIALYSMLHPEAFAFKDYFMTVECEGVITRGMTVADFNNVEKRKPNVRAAVDMDVSLFWGWLTDTLLGSG